MVACGCCVVRPLAGWERGFEWWRVDVVLCGRWLAGSVGLSVYGWMSCSACQRTSQQTNIDAPVGSCTVDSERWMKGALEMEHFSLKRLSAEGLWGGLLYWRHWKLC